MTKPYIERRFVELEEETDYSVTTVAGEEVNRTWNARLYGSLIPTKEKVQMSRVGPTAKDALEALREAVEEQGWELR